MQGAGVEVGVRRIDEVGIIAGVNDGDRLAGAVSRHRAELKEIDAVGTIDLLRAAALLWQQGQRFEVVLAGPEMPNFQRFWQSYPYAPRVRRLGQPPGGRSAGRGNPQTRHLQ